jgi:hypothetical protein
MGLDARAGNVKCQTRIRRRRKLPGFSFFKGNKLVSICSGNKSVQLQIYNLLQAGRLATFMLGKQSSAGFVLIMHVI